MKTSSSWNPDSPVEDDAVVSISAGFTDPADGARLETEFARVPLVAPIS